MIVIYEKGDYVELKDSIEVPYGMGACFVTLEIKHPNKLWTVRLEEGLADKQRGIVHEKWFRP